MFVIVPASNVPKPADSDLGLIWEGHRTNGQIVPILNVKRGLMCNRNWKYFAFTCGPLGRSLNPSMSLTHDRGELFRPNRIGLIASACIKSGVMLAVLALSIVSTAAGQSATTGIAEQAQSTPDGEQPQDRLAAEPVHPGFPIGPIIISPAVWRGFILNTPLPQEACSTATYPDLQWQVVSCGAAYADAIAEQDSDAIAQESRVQPLLQGFGGDVVLGVQSNSILRGEGSFNSVTGVTSEKSNGNLNSFSLQLNTNIFQTSSCSSSPSPEGCHGWVQFIYDSSEKHALIQYWLQNYGNSCPAGWRSDGSGDGGCFRNSHTVNTPGVTIADLVNMRLVGSIGGVFGNPTDDIVAIGIGNTFYAVASGNPIAGAKEAWQEMDFNVFGDGGDSEAVFNPGSSLAVLDSISYASGTLPFSTVGGVSGESNNLNLTTTIPPITETSNGASLTFTECYTPGLPQGPCE
jgi:hypothetical protein